mmetsp:Transcript_16602/g.33054  ORF Transcript_16602/g.33054 Transcript_16602/m.33054 type:complete len:140 (-) Transcript_16602:449-868(-)
MKVIKIFKLLGPCLLGCGVIFQRKTLFIYFHPEWYHRLGPPISSPSRRYYYCIHYYRRFGCPLSSSPLYLKAILCVSPSVHMRHQMKRSTRVITLVESFVEFRPSIFLGLQFHCDLNRLQLLVLLSLYAKPLSPGGISD